ncbi:MAG: Coenzyme F420 hydrogenase/dehydrogenase, beta subunit C-terminal domain, partial [Bdellovibrionales bacterium]|nr:Coenzyme F420 hydrogenase/dehydrogenase, beta subunit C-terminal domain [Bdellovibrionales bacterium]
TLHRETFQKEWDPLAIHGEFDSACLAYATDPQVREHSTSGGFITGLLIELLEQGEIDGALVIGSSENPLWKGRPHIARTREELLASMKSKYAISPTNISFAEVLRTPGKYAMVGLPCQIHGFRKAAELSPVLKERITLAIGLYCHAAVEHEAFRIIWNSMGEKTQGAKRFISRVGKHPGTPHLELEDGSLYPVYFGEKRGYRPSSMEIINIVYRLFTPKRCLTCFDASAEFADLAVGDPWMAPPTSEVDFQKGWSFVLARTQRGGELLSRMERSDAMKIEPVTRREALACNRMMGTEKRWRAFRVIETKRRQGQAIPSYGPYGMELPKEGGWQFMKTEIHMLTHIFCYLPQYRAPILRFMLSNGGYSLLWLNNKRRWFRFFVRDSYAFIRNKVFGRR